MTPHNEAKINDFAKTVLMPGDPKRAKFIAENFLENPRLVNDLRGVQGYTGTYKGVPVSVMASGMGMPSMAIYAHELYTVYNVENIIRIGSCGGINDSLKLFDVVFAQSTCYESGFADSFKLPGVFAPTADFNLLSIAIDAAKEINAPYHVGNVLSSDYFYTDLSRDGWKEMGVLAVEMETAALYMTAAKCSKKALGILTVSDHLYTHEETTAKERETAFTHMMTIALETAVKMC